MTTFIRTLSTKCRNALLTGVALSTLLTPAGVLAAEREGTVLFFSLDDIQSVLTRPSLPSLASLLSPSQPVSSFAWRGQSRVEQGRPPEQHTPYGNGLWADGYHLPGSHPLWGY